MSSLAKVWSRESRKLIYREVDYRYQATPYVNGEGGFIWKDRILKEVTNAKTPKIKFRPSPDPTVRHTAPRDLSTEDFDL